MADDPISTTRTAELGQWADQADPGFEALNDNWQKIDDALLAHGDENPSEYAPGGLFLNTLDMAVYRNDGSEEAPSWTSILDVGTLVTSISVLSTQLDDKADSSDLSVVEADVADHETRIGELEGDVTALEGTIGNAILKDGSVAMEADLDLGSNQIEGVANGVDPDHAVNKAQLEAAISAALGNLGVYYYCRAYASADLALGTSPRTFEADTNDALTTDAAMHSTSSNKDRFVAQVSGYYDFEARFKVKGYAGGGVQWYKNGALADEGVHPQFLSAQGSDITFIVTPLKIQLDAGDYITAKVYGLGEPDSGQILEDSSISMFLLSSNGVGGGDFFADGSVAMTGELDLGGNKAIGAADAEDPTDLTTLQQVEDFVDDEEAARIAADADLQDQIDGLVSPAVPTLVAPELEITSGNFSFSALDPLWSEWTASRLEFTLAGSTRVVMEAEATVIPTFIGQTDAQLGIRLQKLTGPGGSPDGAAEDFVGMWQSLGPFGYGQIGPVSRRKRKTLAAATWRISIIGRKLQTANSNGFYGTAQIPAYIGATYIE